MEFEDWQNFKDEEILEKSLDNPRLFELIVDKYQGSFLRTAKRVLNNKEASEDVCQDAFVKIYFNARKFQKRPGIEFKSWAFKILLNCAFSRYRKLKRTFNDAEYQDQLLYLPLETLDLAFERKETRNEIESIIEKMPQDLAELIREHYLKDRPYAEIAGEKDMSINALKMKLFRARKSFKKTMEKIT